MPQSLRSQLGDGRIHIVHRQEMAFRNDEKRKGVVKLGAESDGAFANRILRKAMGSKQRLLVLNDEGNHCYRPRQKEAVDSPAELPGLGDEQATEEERMKRARGAVITKPEDPPAGVLRASTSRQRHHITAAAIGRQALPWIVSDFWLVDAIESGLVKIPRYRSTTIPPAIRPPIFTLGLIMTGFLPLRRLRRKAARGRA